MGINIGRPWLQLASAVVAFGALTAFAWKTIGLAVTGVILLLWVNNAAWLFGAAIVLVFQDMNQPHDLPFSLYHPPFKASCTLTPEEWLFRGSSRDSAIAWQLRGLAPQPSADSLDG